MLDPAPTPLDALEGDLGFDGDLRDNLDARYGAALGSYRFQLVEVPVKLLAGHWEGEDVVEHLLEDVELDKEWKAEMDSTGIEPGYVFQDAARRLGITRAYIAEFKRARDRRQKPRVAPLILDFLTADGTIDLLDGHHRLGAALHTGADAVRAYHLLGE